MLTLTRFAQRETNSLAAQLRTAEYDAREADRRLAEQTHAHQLEAEQLKRTAERAAQRLAEEQKLIVGTSIGLCVLLFEVVLT